jgi:hypothetical protein
MCEGNYCAPVGDVCRGCVGFLYMLLCQGHTIEKKHASYILLSSCNYLQLSCTVCQKKSPPPAKFLIIYILHMTQHAIFYPIKVQHSTFSVANFLDKVVKGKISTEICEDHNSYLSKIWVI